MTYRLLLLLLTVFALACTNDKKDEDGELSPGVNMVEGEVNSNSSGMNGANLKEGQVQLDIEIRNAANQTITIDFVDFENMETISSVTLDDQGKATYLDYLPYNGIYRLQQTEQNYWLVSLKPGKFSFAADANDLFVYDFSGNEWAESFETSMKLLVDIQQPVNEMYADIQNLQAAGASEAEVQAAAAEADAAAFEMQKTLADHSLGSKNPYVRLYYAGLLLPSMQKLMDYYTEVLNEMNSNMPNSTYTAQLGNYFNQAQAQNELQATLDAQAQNAAVGGVAPEITQPNPEGVNIPLSSLRGKVVLIDFWASWCGPCRVENPNVVATYKKYKDQGFTIYSVSLDDNMQAWKNAIEADGLVWPNHVSDLKGWNSAPAEKYGVGAIPATFLIDESGVIIAKNLRGAALENKLAEIFN